MKTSTIIFVVFLLLSSIYLFVGELGRLYYDRKIETLITRGPEPGDTIPVHVNPHLDLPNRWKAEQDELGNKKDNFLRPFFWEQLLPDDINTIIACCGFTLFGYLISLLLIADEPGKKRIFVGIIASFFTGIVVFVLIHGVPRLFTNKEPNDLFPFAVSLLAGLFIKRFYAILSKKFPTLFA